MKAGYGVIVKQDDGNYVDKGPDYVESLADYDTKSRYTKAEYKEKFQNMFSGRRDTQTQNTYRTAKPDIELVSNSLESMPHDMMTQKTMINGANKTGGFFSGSGYAGDYQMNTLDQRGTTLSQMSKAQSQIRVHSTHGQRDMILRTQQIGNLNEDYRLKTATPIISSGHNHI